MAPLISVIVPCFNCIKTIDETISSIKSQTYQNFEIILVDDGSKDGTLEHLMYFYSGDLKVRVISQQNSGVSAARNHGVKCSSGDYVIFLDSDDLIVPEKLDSQMKVMLEQGADIVLAGLRRFEDIGVDRIWYSDSYPPEATECNYLTSVVSADLFQYANFSTGLFKKRVLEQLSWNSNYRTGEDWELWCRMAQNGFRFVNLKMITNFYRKHSANSTKGYSELMTLMSHVSVIRNVDVPYKIKSRLIAHKMDYYTGLFRNRVDIAFSAWFTLVVYVSRNFAYLKSRSIKNLLVSFLKIRKL